MSGADSAAGAPDFLALSQDHPVLIALRELVEVCDELDIAGHQIENARELLLVHPQAEVDLQAEADRLSDELAANHERISSVDWANPGAELLDRSHRDRIRELLGVALTALWRTVRGEVEPDELRVLTVPERVILAALGAVETIDVELEDLLRGAELAAVARRDRELLDAADAARDFEAALGSVEELLGKTKSDVLIWRQRIMGIGAATGASPPPDPEVRSMPPETRSTVRRVDSRHIRAEGFVEGPGTYRFMVRTDEQADDYETAAELQRGLVAAARRLGLGPRGDS